MDLERGVYFQVRLLAQRVKSASFSANMKTGHKCLDKFEPRLNNYRDVDLQVAWAVLHWWFFFLVLACLLASVELIAHDLTRTNKANRVRPLIEAPRQQPLSIE